MRAIYFYIRATLSLLYNLYKTWSPLRGQLREERLLKPSSVASRKRFSAFNLCRKLGKPGEKKKKKKKGRTCDAVKTLRDRRYNLYGKGPRVHACTNHFLAPSSPVFARFRSLSSRGHSFLFASTFSVARFSLLFSSLSFFVFPTVRHATMSRMWGTPSARMVKLAWYSLDTRVTQRYCGAEWNKIDEIEIWTLLLDRQQYDISKQFCPTIISNLSLYPIFFLFSSWVT